MVGLPPDPAPTPPAGGPWLAFVADGQEYALPIDALVEVIRYRTPTMVPGVSPAVEGILPHRGRMVTLVDLRRSLGLTPRSPGSGARVIVAASGGEWHGVVVDEVVRVVGRHDRILDLETVLGAIR